MVKARCNDPGCRWALPRTDPNNLRLAQPVPESFRAQLADGSEPEGHSLFCGGVGEGFVDEESGVPDWLFCRESECDECGFRARFPECPTVAGLGNVTCRVLSSAVAYVNWLAANPDAESGDGGPGREKLGEIDQLVEVKLPAPTFLRYLAERMDEWAPHYHVEQHQLKMRAECIRQLSLAPAGERLVILTDWSEKLSLEPNFSATGETYAKVGVLVNVCLFRDASGHVRCETHVGLCEKPTNDVPHTHAVLRKVLQHYTERVDALGAKLGAVDVWSDGGQAHFKLAEAFVYGAHFLRLARELTKNPSCQFTWHYMQAYHGKGPYDAEGGCVKYLIRRQIMLQGFAFDNAYAVYSWASSQRSMLEAKQRKAGTDSRVFKVVARHFYYVSEEELASLQYCTSPRFESFPAEAEDRGAALMKVRDGIYCVRPNPNPGVVPFLCRPANVGFVPDPNTEPRRPLVFTPYEPATLNALANKGTATFTGSWRRYSCFCQCCTHGVGQCTFYGDAPPPPWVPFSVRRSPYPPSKSQKEGFIAQFVDDLADKWQGSLDELIGNAALFIRKRFRRFKTLGEAEGFVKRRVEARRQRQAQGGSESEERE